MKRRLRQRRPLWRRPLLLYFRARRRPRAIARAAPVLKGADGRTVVLAPRLQLAIHLWRVVREARHHHHATASGATRMGADAPGRPSRHLHLHRHATNPGAALGGTRRDESGTGQPESQQVRATRTSRADRPRSSPAAGATPDAGPRAVAAPAAARHGARSRRNDGAERPPARQPGGPASPRAPAAARPNEVIAADPPPPLELASRPPRYGRTLTAPATAAAAAPAPGSRLGRAVRVAAGSSAARTAATVPLRPRTGRPPSSATRAVGSARAASARVDATPPAPSVPSASLDVVRRLHARRDEPGRGAPDAAWRAPAALDYRRASARDPDLAAAAAGPVPAPPQAVPAIDIDALSREVISRIEQRLRIERERHGRF